MTKLLINLALMITLAPALAAGFAFEHALAAFRLGRELYHEFAKWRLAMGRTGNAGPKADRIGMFAPRIYKP